MTKASKASVSGESLAEHRPVLLRYALTQLKHLAPAEDVVQETLLAALQPGSAFDGSSSPRTWLIGILKHKIADYWRRSSREVSLDDPEQVGQEEGDEADWFDERGSWRSRPNAWSDPESALNQREFWTAYEWCQRKLPPKMAQVFMLRELVGLDADEICKETGLSSTNYWVMMHRARLRLRECLEIRWFGKIHA